MKTHEATPIEEELKEANSCLAMGASIGAAGAGAAVLAGATCPLCMVFAPTLIGIGAWKRYSAKRKQLAGSEHRDDTNDLEAA